MKNVSSLLASAVFTTCMMASGAVFAADALQTKLSAAMADKSRPAGDVARDANRKPIETLAFFGLKDNMTVVEIMPGGGWYTRLLAPTLKEKGKLYVAYTNPKYMGDLLEKPAFAEVGKLGEKASFTHVAGPVFNLGNAQLDVKNADMVLTFRNYHNLDAAGRKAMNEAAYNALKVGGVYGVVDHTRRHMEQDNAENGRRFDPVLAIKEIQDAGFMLVDISELHYQPTDALDKEVGHDSVKGKTDRWTLKFIKKK